MNTASIDEGAIGTLQIRDDVAPLLVREPRVRLGHVGLWQHQVVAVQAANGDLGRLEIHLVLGAAAVGDRDRKHRAQIELESWLPRQGSVGVLCASTEDSMARRRKRKPSAKPDEETTGSRAPRVGTALGTLLKGVRAASGPGQASRKGVRTDGTHNAVPSAAPADPSEKAQEAAQAGLQARELRLLNDVYSGVTPLSQTRGRVGQRAARKMPSAPSEAAAQVRQRDLQDDHAARRRLGALVGGGVTFVVDEVGEDLREAVRQGVSARELRRLRSPRFHPEATLDLHGESREAVELLVSRFVREHHRRGCRYLLVIHGKGLHSDAGIGVLGAAVFSALTAGGAAPLVRGLTLAHPQLGGSGATAVMLM